MKVDDAIETISRFFNDLIGTLIPGAVLGAGLAIMHAGPVQELVKDMPKDSGFFIALSLALLFAVGHGVLAVYTLAVQRLLEALHLTRKDVVKTLEKKQSFTAFREMVLGKLGQDHSSQSSGRFTLDWDYNDLRNLALSVSGEASSLGRRFMFISLLCNGVGTALLILLVDFTGCILFAPKALYPYAAAWPELVQMALLLLVAVSFFKRGEGFYGRAMSTPFAVALAELALKQVTGDNKKS